MLRVVVRSQGQEQVVEHQGGPLEFGRGVARDVPRCFVPDPYVSRNHARIELQPNGSLLVQNLSQMSPIGLNDGGLIPSGEARALALPQRLRMGESEIEIALTEPAGTNEPAYAGPAQTVIASQPPRGYEPLAQTRPGRAPTSEPGPGSTVIASAPPEPEGTSAIPEAAFQAGPASTVIASAPPDLHRSDDSSQGVPPREPLAWTPPPAGPGSTVIAAMPDGPPAVPVEQTPSASEAQPAAWSPAPAGPGSTVIAALPDERPADLVESSSESQRSAEWPSAAPGTGSTVIAAFPGDRPAGPVSDTRFDPPASHTVIATAAPESNRVVNEDSSPTAPEEAPPSIGSRTVIADPPDTSWQAADEASWDPEPMPPPEPNDAAVDAASEFVSDTEAEDPLTSTEAPTTPAETAATAGPALAAEFLFHLWATTAPAPSLEAVQTPHLLAITGGGFEGPQLRGAIAASGASALVTPQGDGTGQLDLRLGLTADDVPTILLTGSAILASRDGEVTLRGALRLAAQDDARSWLNACQALAIGRVGEGGLALDVFVLR